MARLSRIVIPYLPHLVTQRGNRREQIFFCDDDYRYYISMLSVAAEKARSEVLAWCLMPNHVHLIIVPKDEDGLRQTVANVHRRYSARINAENEWTGHLWQGRYGSVVMDEAHLYNAIAYVSLNPVRAGLVRRAKDWKWSSVQAHLKGKDDGLTSIKPVIARTGKFSKFLRQNWSNEDFDPLRKAEIIGRPVGNDDFIKNLETKLDRKLFAQKRGRKKKSTG
jgi:putative transposase